MLFELFITNYFKNAYDKRDHLQNNLKFEYKNGLYDKSMLFFQNSKSGNKNKVSH